MPIALIRSAHCDEDHILGRPHSYDENRCIEINDGAVFCLLTAPFERPVSKSDPDVEEQLGARPGALRENPLSAVERWHREFTSNCASSARNVSRVGPWQLDLCEDAPKRA